MGLKTIVPLGLKSEHMSLKSEQMSLNQNKYSFRLKILKKKKMDATNGLKFKPIGLRPKTVSLNTKNKIVFKKNTHGSLNSKLFFGLKSRLFLSINERK